MPNWENGATGAAGGAALGATVGSVFPGIGTAVGAGAGAGLGFLAGAFGSDGTKTVPGYDERQKQLLEQAHFARQRGVLYGDQQRAMMSLLYNRAQGQDSAAMRQLGMAGDRMASQQLGLAAAARPGQGGMMARTAMLANERMRRDLAGQAAIAAAQERQAASGQLLGFMGYGLQNQQANDQRDLAMRELELKNALGTNFGPSTGDKLFAAGGSALPLLTMGNGQPQGGKLGL